jgi:hypothetical protein
MEINFKTFISIISFCLIFDGCKIEGCMDINAENYNPEAKSHDDLCTFRHLTSIIINDLRTLNWDTLAYENAYPDLKFYLKPSYFLVWEIETSIAYNVNTFPYKWDITITDDRYLLWNEEYTFMLTDEDQKGYEIIHSGTFVPSQTYSDEKIILKNHNETVEIELSFIVF